MRVRPQPHAPSLPHVLAPQRRLPQAEAHPSTCHFSRTPFRDPASKAVNPKKHKPDEPQAKS